MTISRYVLSVLVPVLGLGAIAFGSITFRSIGMAHPISDRPMTSSTQLTSDKVILAQASTSRTADCRQMEQFLSEVTTAFEAIGSRSESLSPREALAQLDTMTTLIDGYIRKLQAMQLSDPQMKQFRTRYITAFQEVRQFIQTVRSAGTQGDEESIMQSIETFFQKIESYAALDESLRRYCGFAATPGQSPPSQQPTRRPSPQAPRPESTTQRNAQTQQLNTQLQAAVDAKDWNRAIQIVDRLIAMHPQRASELQRYRARLVQLRNAR